MSPIGKACNCPINSSIVSKNLRYCKQGPKRKECQASLLFQFNAVELYIPNPWEDLSLSTAYQSLLNPIQQCNTGCALPLIKHSTRQSFDMDSWRCTMLEDKREERGFSRAIPCFPTRCEKCCFVMFSLCIKLSVAKSGPLEKTFLMMELTLFSFKTLELWMIDTFKLNCALISFFCEIVIPIFPLWVCL